MSASSYEKLLQEVRDVDVAELSPTVRNELVVAIRRALQKIETPWQRMQSMVWENSGHAAALKIAHDLQLFEKWAPYVEETMETERLRSLLSADCEPALLERVLDALAYKGTLDSPGPGKYKLNDFSAHLSQPRMAACLDYWFDIQLPALTSLPEYVQSASYRLPTDPAHTAWNLATRDSAPFFDWLQQRPDKLANFAQVMQCYSESQPPWIDIYPAEKLMTGTTPGAPILVDIGGSRGHDLAKFVEKYDPPAGSCYLLDQGDVVSKAQVNGKIVVRAHDFLKEPQPILGAKAYYLHNVLHDWTDEQCRGILSNIKNAMSKENSKILIHELVKMEDGARDVVSVGEWTMLSILGSPERTEKQWKELVASSGLRVSQVYSHPLSLHSVLEVEVVE